MTRRRKRQLLKGDDPEWKEAIKGVEVEISMSRSDGRFHCYFAGEPVSAYLKEELVKDVERLIKKSTREVKIPVTMVGVVKRVEEARFGRPGGASWTRGVGARHLYLRKIHVGTGGVLAVDDDGAKENLDRSYAFGVDDEAILLKRLSDAEIAEYKVLATAARDARKKFEQFINKRKIDDPKKLVERALRESADDPKEEER